MTNQYLIFPTYLPFAYDNNNNWGNNHIDLRGVLEIELNDVDGNFSDEEDMLILICFG